MRAGRVFKRLTNFQSGKSKTPVPMNVSALKGFRSFFSWADLESYNGLLQKQVNGEGGFKGRTHDLIRAACILLHSDAEALGHKNNIGNVTGRCLCLVVSVLVSHLMPELWRGKSLN